MRTLPALLLLLSACSMPITRRVDAGPLEGDAGALADAGPPGPDAGALADAGPSGPDAAVDAYVVPEPDAALPFVMDRWEVGWGEWPGFAAADPDAEPPHSDELRCTSQRRTGSESPVNCVTWETAAAYCAWHQQRLPTRAEWLEEAERTVAGMEIVGATPEGAPYYEPSQNHVCTQPVCNLRGNVSEWVSDEDGAGGHVIMGAAYDAPAPALTESSSSRQRPQIGFRCWGL